MLFFEVTVLMASNFIHMPQNDSATIATKQSFSGVEGFSGAIGCADILFQKSTTALQNGEYIYVNRENATQ